MGDFSSRLLEKCDSLLYSICNCTVSYSVSGFMYTTEGVLCGLFYFMGLLDQPHPVQHPFMGSGADRHINPGRLDPAMPQHIRQMRQVLLNGVKGTCEQVAQVVREYFAGLHLRVFAKLLHIVADVGAVQGFSAFRAEDATAFNPTLFCIPFQPIPQLLL